MDMDLSGVGGPSKLWKGINRSLSNAVVSNLCNKQLLTKIVTGVVNTRVLQVPRAASDRPLPCLCYSHKVQLQVCQLWIHHWSVTQPSAEDAVHVAHHLMQGATARAWTPLGKCVGNAMAGMKPSVNHFKWLKWLKTAKPWPVVLIVKGKSELSTQVWVGGEWEASVSKSTRSCQQQHSQGTEPLCHICQGELQEP